MSKRKIESYIIAAAVAAFISGFGAGTAHTERSRPAAVNGNGNFTNLQRNTENVGHLSGDT